MRQGIAKAAAIGALAVVPAVALADSTTYKGEGTSDPAAKIELRISDGDEPQGEEGRREEASVPEQHDQLHRLGPHREGRRQGQLAREGERRVPGGRQLRRRQRPARPAVS